MKQEAHCTGCNRTLGVMEFEKHTFGWKCGKCGALTISEDDPGSCPSCDEIKMVSLGEYKASRVSPSICQRCQDEIDKFDHILSHGGVRWKCMDCNTEGVFEAPHPFAQMFRDQMLDPSTSGLLLNREDCPFCRRLAAANIPLPVNMMH